MTGNRVHPLTVPMLAEYQRYLAAEEKSKLTIEKYSRDLRGFFLFAAEVGGVDKAAVIAYKAHLTANYTAASVNSMLAALNGFLRYQGWEECRVRPLKTQQRLFCAQEKELSKGEYLRLLAAAQRKHNQRLYLLLQTICATGIRVSELSFITLQAAKNGRAEVRCKRKVRPVFLPRKLCILLLRYAKEQGVTVGSLFVTRTGKPLDRSNIWAEMKSLCVEAQVAASKVFPHNLRHLFARTYYSQEKDITRLADLLGHSSIDTTRIYTVSSGQEHQRQIAALGLVV